MTTATTTLSTDAKKVYDYLKAAVTRKVTPTYGDIKEFMQWSVEDRDEKLGITLLEVLEYSMAVDGLPLTAIVVYADSGAPAKTFYGFMKRLDPQYAKANNLQILVDCYKRLGYTTEL
jgi:hypothetical protein